MYRNTATITLERCIGCESCHECGAPADELVPMLYPASNPQGVPFCSTFCRDFTLLMWRAK